MRELVLGVVLIACGNRSERKPPATTESGSAAVPVAALPPGKPIDLAPKAKTVFGDGPRHASSIEMVAFSADGSRLASVDREGHVFVWDVASGKPIAASLTETSPRFVAFAGAKVVTTAPVEPDLPRGMKPTAVSIAGGTLAVLDEDQSVSAGPLAGPLQRIVEPYRGTYLASVSPDGKRIATVAKDDNITIRSGSAVKTIHVDGLDDSGGTTTLVWSPDGAQLALAVGGRELTLVDTRTSTIRAIAKDTFANDIMVLTFSPDGTRIAGGTSYGRVRLWDAKTGALVNTHAGHVGTAWDIAVTDDGGTLASAGDERALLWKPAAAEYGDHEHWVTHVALSADGKLLASCSDYGDLNVRELPAGMLVAKLQLPNSECERLAIAGDRVIGATGNAAHIFPIADGAKPRTVALSAGRKYGSSAFAASRDGSLLANGGDDGQIAVHAATGARRWLVTLPADPDEENERIGVHALAFDDTGTQLAAVTDDEKLRLYDARTGRVLRTHQLALASPGWLTSVAFMGTRVAVGASSGEVFVIDAQGKTVFTANQTMGGIYSLTATKTQLFTGGESGDVVVWDVP